MKIYTSYFANLKNIPSDIIPISIARKTPPWFDGLSIKLLAPDEHTLLKYNYDGNHDRYIKEYSEEVLKLLYAPKLVHYFEVKSGGKDVVLLCYESPEKFCHRHLLSDWLNKNGFHCKEYSNEMELMRSET